MNNLGILGDEISDTQGFADVPDVSVDALSNRVIPRQVQSGVERGTNIIMNTDGSYITTGQIPNSTDFGIALFDASGNIVSKSTSSTQSFYDATSGKNIVQVGKLTNGQYGMKVAQSGFDVTTATNSQLVFNSSQDVFKIVASGTGQTNSATATATAGTWSSSNQPSTTIPHGLTFTPGIIAFCVQVGVYFPLPSTSFSAGFLNNNTFSFTSIAAEVDATNVYLSCQVAQYGANTASQGPFTIKYYLLQETAN